jgi:hypothetical protein
MLRDAMLYIWYIKTFTFFENTLWDEMMRGVQRCAAAGRWLMAIKYHITGCKTGGKIFHA